MLNITQLLFWLGRPVSKVERASPTQASSYTPGDLAPFRPNSFYLLTKNFQVYGLESDNGSFL